VLKESNALNNYVLELCIRLRSGALIVGDSRRATSNLPQNNLVAHESRKDPPLILKGLPHWHPLWSTSFG